MKPSWAVEQVTRTSGLVEDVCVHGIGHPNIESLKEMERRKLHGFELHGCDGCCSRKKDKEDK